MASPIGCDEVGPRPEPAIWSVFDLVGDFLGEVTVPARFMMSCVRDDRILGIYQDSIGVKEVRAYALTKPQPRT
jgi:hypothetical protein